MNAVAYFAHALRYFKDAQSVNAERANWILSQIQKLYKLEDHIRTEQLKHEARCKLRQMYALPILAEMKSWLDEHSKHVLPKSTLSKAIGYTLTQWQRLVRYTKNDMLEIDNNWIENLICPLALGRKNYLFAGSYDGAHRTAII